MQVILMERIEKLGQMGDEVTVKPGYARNYLLPQKKAVSLTEENKAHFQVQRAQLEAANLERKGEAEKVGAKLDGLQVVMIRQAGETGYLYGSVKARDISVGVSEAGFTVTRQQVSLSKPIKILGLHEVDVALHPEVTVSVVVNVARSEEESEVQRKTGKAVIATDEEEDVGQEEEAPPAPLDDEAPDQADEPEEESQSSEESDPAAENADDGEKAEAEPGQETNQED